MRFEQVRQILENVRAFHKCVGGAYKQLSDRATQERVRLLLDYMSMHEERFAAAMAEYEKNADDSLLDTWMDYRQAQGLTTVCEQAAAAGNLTVPEAIELGLRVDDALLQFYRHAASHAEPVEIRDLFAELSEMTESEERLLTRNALAAFTL